MSTPAEKAIAAGLNFGMGVFDGIAVPSFSMDKMETMKSREMRADDIILCTYPKSGTHWVWEILHMVMAGRVEYAKQWLNSAFLEYRTEDELEELESPRIIHTHLLPRMLPESIWQKKCKIVYVERNPKDCFVSLYCQDTNQIWSNSGMNAKMPSFTGSWDDYLNLYLEGSVAYGSWFDYTLDWNSIADCEPGIQICKVVFEDLKRDCAQEIKTMAEYLARPLSDSICREIAEACSFQRLKHVSENVKDQTFHIRWKEGTSGYFRKGVVGDWKNWFTVAQNERFNSLYEEKFCKQCD